MAQSCVNGVAVLLFSSTVRDEYVFEGEVVLASDPYYEIQSDEIDQKRKVVIFPLRLAD
ncbi:MAG: hypothetical protein Q4C68_01930 [Moraxella sp.]|nr:hypothetical protein [Moraxella sp.]